MKETKTAVLNKELVFAFEDYSLSNRTRVLPAGTEVYIDKAWKSGAVRLRVKGNLHTRQLSPAQAQTWITKVGA